MHFWCRCYEYLFTLVASAVLFVVGNVDGQETSGNTHWLQRAHAHNDYYHRRPLLDALDQGFQSVEADVFARNGDLFVAHTFLEIKPERTLEKLYLKPLFSRVNSKDPARKIKKGFLLLIDFKTDGKAALAVLEEQLQPYSRYLTQVVDGKWVPGNVTIVISGNRPVREIQSAKNRFVFLDGRLNDPKEWGREITPLVSESWNTHFKYRGFGEMPKNEVAKLNLMVRRTHQQGKKIRFWALPDRERGWQIAFDAGVDLINTDQLEELRFFLLKQKTELDNR